MRSHSLFSSILKSKLPSLKIGRISYDLVAGLSYITVIPNTVLSQFSPTLTNSGIVSGLLGVGLAGGSYWAYTDVKQINEDNEKILKNFLFLLFYTTQILENNHLFDAIKNYSDHSSTELDEKKQQSMLAESDDEQVKINILRELKETGFSESSHLTREQGLVLQRYMFAMSTQTEDNINEFYRINRDFHSYLVSDAQDSQKLREFWQIWIKENFFSDSLIIKAVINTKTWEEACRQYANDYQEDNLKHLQKQITEKLKKTNKKQDASRFLAKIKSLIDVLAKFPLDNNKFTEIMASTRGDFSGANSQFLTEVSLYLHRLSQLKEKIAAMTEVLSPFYDQNGLIFLKGFEAWLTNHTIDYYLRAKNSKIELLEKAFVWAVSSLGVYDTFRGLSASSSKDDSSSLLDWARVFVGCVSAAVGSLVWDKLEKTEKVRQAFFSRLYKQLDAIQLLVKSDTTFAPLPSPQPLYDAEQLSSREQQTLQIKSGIGGLKL